MIVLDPRFSRHPVLWHSVVQAMDTPDLAHDALHVDRVYRWCIALSAEGGCDTDLAGAAALVHDAVNVPKHLPDRPLGSERSAELAAGLLPDAGYDEPETATIVEAVRTCSWSRGLTPTGPLGRVLQDADRLDAIGMVGLLRMVACGQTFAAAGIETALYHPQDPAGRTDRPRDDRRWVMDHVHCKLLHLIDTMHLPTARAEGRRRHQRLLVALDELADEVSAPASGSTLPA